MRDSASTSHTDAPVRVKERPALVLRLELEGTARLYFESSTSESYVELRGWLQRSNELEQAKGFLELLRVQLDEEWQ